jgi:hypothetical protein
VLFHDRESRGALAYLALAGEMIRREEEERENVAHAATATVATGDNGGGVAIAPESTASETATNGAAAEPQAGEADGTPLEADVVDSTRAHSGG